ncbi:MAG: MarR family transcriptional regulator [Anderseniella sp.]
MNRTASLGPVSRPDTAKQLLRVWLRVLKLQRQMESALRDRLRTTFDTTLPRFDVLAALDHHADGLRMSALSSWLKVSNGNITGIVDRLVEDGLVVRVPVEGDRRAMLVRLTRKGSTLFQGMAEAHQIWVGELLGDLTSDEAGLMMSLLDKAAKSNRGKP